MSRGMMRAVVPELVEAHPRKSDRRRHDRKRQELRVVLREVPRRREQEIGARQQMRRDREERQHDAHVARDAHRREVGVDDAAMRRRIRHRHDVRRRRYCSDRHRLARERIRLGHHADELVVEQRRQVQLAGRLGPVADHDVEPAVRERPLVVVLGAERVQRESRLRSALAQRLHHARQERHDDVVGAADLERLLRGRRRELVAFDEELVDLLERDARRGEDLERPLGRRPFRPSPARAADRGRWRAAASARR